MIVEFIFNALFNVVNLLIGLLPSLPGGNIIDNLDIVFDFIFSNLDLIDMFVRPSTFKIIIPLFLGVNYFEEVYSLIIFVVKKIPMLNVE